MTLIPLEPLVEHTKELMHAVKSSYIQVAVNLHTIKQDTNWKEYGLSWSQFCEQYLEISQTQASKLEKVYSYYLEQGQIEQSKLETIDLEKLYLATKLDGEVEENLARASTLSRADLKQQKAEDKPHEPEWITYCKICGLSEANHP